MHRIDYCNWYNLMEDETVHAKLSHAPLQGTTSTIELIPAVEDRVKLIETIIVQVSNPNLLGESAPASTDHSSEPFA